MPWKPITRGQVREYDGSRARIRVPWPTDALMDPLDPIPKRLVEGTIVAPKLVVPGLGDLSLHKKEYEDLEVWTDEEKKARFRIW